MSKKSIMGGGARHASKSKNLKTFVALGLSAVLPSLAFSAESNEALNQLLTTAPQTPSDSKTQKMENYSPVVDLRSSRAIENDGSIFNNNPVNITQDTTIGTELSRWDIGTDSRITKTSKNITITNDATLTIKATNTRGYGYIFATADSSNGQITWNGGNIVIDFLAAGDGGIDYVRGGLLAAEESVFKITSNLDYAYTENANGTGTGDYRAKGVSAIDASYGGTMKLLGDKTKITANGKNNQNIGLGIFALLAHDNGTIYVNTNDDGSIHNKNAIVQVTGSLSTGLTLNSNQFSGNGKIYANFTGQNSYLKGNIYSGRYDGGSKVVATFSNGATMEGEIVFLGNSTPTSTITFASGSKLTGDINSLASGKHSVIFNNASFIGTIKSDQNAIQGATIGGTTGNSIDQALGTTGNGSNTLVSFVNTDEQQFGDGTYDIVDSSYLGKIKGTFDLSDGSTTVINGGSGGTLGFKGSGTNTLIFDFKGNAQASASSQFTIANGSATSIYVMNAFTQSGENAFDYSTVSSSETLYNKLANAGIKVAVDTDKDNTNNHLNGTLFFQNTNITVKSGALFDSSDNIVGSGKSLNNLAMGAMFGNATWNDANKDGAITANEIIANATNYKLTGSTDTNDKSSNGNIGADSDGIKKEIAFIFANGVGENLGYEFGGGADNKQGYSGTIRGGTEDSKYYFANAGYINRSQIDNALGDLVLFNTAFRGDLGVNNKNVGIFLDFSNNRNGLRAEQGDSNANIVGSGSKNVIFNFTGNDKQVKYAGAVVGNTGSDNAQFTILNLVKNSANGVVAGDGSLSASNARGGAGKTLINALQESGLSNFDKTDGNGVNTKGYGPSGDGTDIGNLSTSKTTLTLRGTSLDATNLVFDNYIYDLAFGEGIGEVEGVSVRNTTLKGDIDLSSNANLGHKIILKGNALLNDVTEIKFNTTDGKENFGTSGGGVFVYDDSTATYSTPKTLKISGFAQDNYLTTNSSINISKTNLEGDLWIDNSSAVNLNFTNGRTWKMDESGFNLASGSNVIVNGDIQTLNGSDAPILRIKNTGKLGTIQLINTGADAKFNITSGYGDGYAQSFYLRGTSFKNLNDSNAINRIAGVVDNGTYNMVFAKGTNLQTTVMNSASGGTAYNITDEGVNSGYVNGKKLSHTGNYSNGVYDGNYIAQSSGAISGFNSNSGFNLTFIGEQAWDTSTIAQNNFFKRDSSFTLVNASNAVAFDATNIGNFFKRSGDDIGVKTTINIEGTSIQNGNNIVGRTNAGQQALLTYNMTFVKGTTGTYVSDTSYSDIATTTTANGALSDSVLKVAQSSLDGGLTFGSANFNVLFVGDGSQSLSGTNVFQGGSDTSVVTFRDSNLNAGGTSTSSLRGIKGTITFDLSHANEDMSISGTLSNMFADNGHYQTKFGEARADNIDSLTFDKLVFVKMDEVSGANTLTSLKSNGNYFSDKETFGNLSEADYSKFGYIKDLNPSQNSSLTFGEGTIALNGANQEIVFVGAGSHNFDASSGVTKLGNSSGSTLTFIDAGNIKVENIRAGQGTINLIGSTNLDISGSGTNNTLTLKYTNGGTSTTGQGITINAIFSGSNVLGTGVAVKDKQGSSASDISAQVASNVDIGQEGEATVYHILFDYTDILGGKEDQGFGNYQVYQGTIRGLTSDSVIKFKNAGYIDGSQIADTDAKIFVDNTQLKYEFRGDNAVLDFRKGRSTIAGDILTSDTRALSENSGADQKPTTNVLSQKILTFDLTNDTSKKLDYDFNIQAGYNIETAYTAVGQSVLTFQNASNMTLGDDDNRTRTTNTNPSDFIRSLNNDVGFSQIGLASATAPATPFNSKNDKASYILKGTKLVFQGTNISGDAVTEDNYELDLSFDARISDRGQTELGETLNASKLTLNTLAMGEIEKTAGVDVPLGLSLSFKNQGSLEASNGLNVKLKEGARFNLSAESSNGNIGTIILSQNDGKTNLAKLANVSKDSTLDISAGSMSFIGNFSQNTTPSATGASAGAINVAFNGTNKVFGTIAGQGQMIVLISGDAIVDNTSANYDWAKPTSLDTNVVIDMSNSTSTTDAPSSITLAHTSGNIGVIGKAIGGSDYASANFTNATGDITLKGAFKLAEDVVFSGNNSARLKIGDNTTLNIANAKSLTITEQGVLNTLPSTTSLSLKVGGKREASNLTLTNLGEKLSSISISTNNESWAMGGNWNIKGTNVTLSSVVAEYDGENGYKKSFIFANGNGTTTSDNQTLNSLQGDARIANSSLTLSETNIFDDASLVLIGKEALAGDADTHKFDGSDKSGVKTTIGLYNTILASGDVLLDNTNTSDWSSGAGIDDIVEIRGTDIFNLSAQQATRQGGGSNPNSSVINAVFVNDSTQTDSTPITGVNYIDSASDYPTNNAGGVLGEGVKLKTLKSKAYGNITLSNDVTATMKFIGSNSHSFDGKTKVDGDNVYYSADGTNWKQYEIGNGTNGKTNGAVYLSSKQATIGSATLATLTGGYKDSRFDFDHTTVSLQQIKGAGGATYVYNSDVVGEIAVTGTPADSSTTVVFTDGNTPSQSSQDFVNNHFEDLGISIDFGTAHKMTDDNLNGKADSKTLNDTSRQTNLIFIGKGSVETNNTNKLNNSGESIDLSFLKNVSSGAMGQSGYSFTIIEGGKIDGAELESKVVGGGVDQSDPSQAKLTIFKTAKVQLVNTAIVGARNFAQVGFINTGVNDNLTSSWGGGSTIDQFLIFDFQKGTNNQALNQGNADAINNASANSHYIFTSIFADGANSVLTLSPNGLKTAINDQLKVVSRTRTSENVISDAVTGYLGLRGVSVKGNIDEATNGVDIVFNSTDNTSYLDGFDTSGNHTSKIVKGEGNYVAVAEGDANEISGKATLEASTEGGIVEIKGDSNKHITFIGEGAVKGGFDKLRISAGGDDSIYRFYEVGSLNQTFLTGVGLYNEAQTTATKGSFVFENTAISGNINANQNAKRGTALDPNNKNNKDNMLVFNNVNYSGEISGSLRKVLSFGANTDNVKISGGSDDSSYDFSNLAGKSVILSIDMTDTANSKKFYASKVTGFENGNVSLVGSIKLAKDISEVASTIQDYSNSFAFNNDASWRVTDNSSVMNLSLENTGLNYNLDLASEPRKDGKERILKVGTFTGKGGQILLGTVIDTQDQSKSQSDKINADTINGTLYVTAQDANITKGSFKTNDIDAIVLVTADTNYGEVKGAERKQGLSYVVTEVKHQVNSNGANLTGWEDATGSNQANAQAHRWVLSSFGAETNQELVDESGFIVSNPYRMLMIETNNLNKRMGDLRDDDYNQGAWIRVFNGMDSGEGAKNLYTNIQLGYDYGTPAIGAKNYSGVAFSTSIVDIDGNQYSGKANTYSLAAYNAYIADSGLYVDTIAKYLYTDQKITPAGSSDSSFGSHALSLGVEVGYRAYMGESNFYIEPQAEAIGGIIFGVKDINMGVIGGVDVTGELKTTTTINTRVGLVQGYSLKTQSGFRADFRLGVSLVNEFVSESDPVRLYDGITEASTSIGNDVKAVVNVGTNLILTDQWRVYIDAERSFGGNRNVDYQANIGARFSFGDKLTSLPKPEKPLPLKLKSEEKKEQDKATVSNTQEAKN